MKRLILLTALFVFAVVGSAMAADNDTVDVVTEVTAVYSLAMGSGPSFNANDPATGYLFTLNTTSVTAGTNDPTWKITVELFTNNLPPNSELYVGTDRVAGDADNSGGTGFTAVTAGAGPFMTGTATGANVVSDVLDWLFNYGWDTVPEGSATSVVKFVLASQ